MVVHDSRCGLVEILLPMGSTAAGGKIVSLIFFMLYQHVFNA